MNHFNRVTFLYFSVFAKLGFIKIAETKTIEIKYEDEINLK